MPKRLVLKTLGRRPKPNKELFIQVTCVLRRDTVERLKEGADSRYFGSFLQEHLDRYPPPSREHYLALKHRTEYWTTFKRKRVPVIIATGSPSPEARKLARERARREKLSPERRAREDQIADMMNTLKAQWQQH